jgi:hypothetical protein
MDARRGAGGFVRGMANARAQLIAQFADRAGVA